MEIFTLQGVK